MPSGPLPFVSVVVPVYNDRERLARCLSALAAQTYPRDRFEVIVADNGSTQDIAEVVAAHGARLVKEPRPGSYAARNHAVAEARGEVLAFTDADCLPHTDWVERGVQALTAAGPGSAVGGAVELFAEDEVHPTWVEVYELALGFPQQFYVESKHFSVTANLFVTRAAWQLAGPFDAQRKSGGDAEWGQRAHAAGVRLLYAAEARVDHPARRAMPELLEKRARLVHGYLSRARAKYPNILATPLVFGKACLPPVVRMLRKRPPPPGLLPALGYHAKVFAVAASLQAYSAYEVVRLALYGDRER